MRAAVTGSPFSRSLRLGTAHVGHVEITDTATVGDDRAKAFLGAIELLCEAERWTAGAEHFDIDVDSGSGKWRLRVWYDRAHGDLRELGPCAVAFRFRHRVEGRLRDSVMPVPPEAIADDVWEILCGACREHHLGRLADSRIVARSE